MYSPRILNLHNTNLLLICFIPKNSSFTKRGEKKRKNKSVYENKHPYLQRPVALTTQYCKAFHSSIASVLLTVS
jgi:hypothetical protein